MTHRALVVLLTVISWIPIDSLECASGYGQKVRVIPDTWINDGFCDCPLDALDETDTDACAGAPVGGWAGVYGATMDRSPTFSCPQQPKKKIPLSRLNDGVCDCCDGADESVDGVCLDICDHVLREEREARAKAESDYKAGSAKRSEELAAFQTLVQETLEEIGKVERELKAKDSVMQANANLLQKAKQAYAEQRELEVIKTIASSDSGTSDLLDPLTNDEISQLIQLTCQIAGEMEGSIKERTCVPLRLAGIDLGILWKDEVFVNASAELVNTNNEDGRSILLKLVINNSEEGEKFWSIKQVTEDTKGKKDRRRLEDHYPDDDYDEEYGEDNYEDQEYEETVTKFEQNQPSDESNEDEEGEEISKVKASVESSVLSRPRRNFLAHSERLVRKIDEFLKIKEEEINKEGGELAVGEESEDTEIEGTESATESTSFDPMAYNLAKSSLRRRQQAIKRGFQYAVSGKILLDAVKAQEDETRVRENLMGLAMSTLWHSRVSTEHVWRILTTILPEYEIVEDSQTCSSHLVSICPAKLITRNGNEYPPAQYMKSAQAACEQAVDEINASGCRESVSDEIDTHVPDGYYGYNEIKPRPEDDVLEQLFSTLTDMSLTDVNELEAKQESLEQDIKSLKENIKSLEDKIGGREVRGDTIRAELHAMKDKCFVVTEGKYDYEVCIFGKSAQRDKGNGGGGTSLGNWQGMSFDEEAGHRVMKWERGQKCWNGPQRSATVIVKCGAETKLLSAEEPDTCTYAMEMESHIACDDDYYQKYLA